MRDVLDVSMVPGDHRRWLLRVIPQVVDEARRSLCAKDRRGAGVWHRNYDHLSLGNNNPPAPFRCDGSDDFHARSLAHPKHNLPVLRRLA